MTPDRLDEIRALAAALDQTHPVADACRLALRDLLEAHEGLRSRVLGLAREMEEASIRVEGAPNYIARRVRGLL